MVGLLEEEQDRSCEIKESIAKAKNSSMVLSETFRELEAIPMLKGER